MRIDSDESTGSAASRFVAARPGSSFVTVIGRRGGAIASWPVASSDIRTVGNAACSPAHR